MRQLHALLARIAGRLFCAAREMLERRAEEIVGAGLPVLVRALAVETPGEDRARAAPPGRLQRLHEVSDERGLAGAAHGVEGVYAGRAAVPGGDELRHLRVAAVELLREGLRQLRQVYSAMGSRSRANLLEALYKPGRIGERGVQVAAIEAAKHVRQAHILEGRNGERQRLALDDGVARLALHPVRLDAVLRPQHGDRGGLLQRLRDGELDVIAGTQVGFVAPDLQAPCASDLFQPRGAFKIRARIADKDVAM